MLMLLTLPGSKEELQREGALFTRLKNIWCHTGTKKYLLGSNSIHGSSCPASVSQERKELNDHWALKPWGAGAGALGALAQGWHCPSAAGALCHCSGMAQPGTFPLPWPQPQRAAAPWQLQRDGPWLGLG